MKTSEPLPGINIVGYFRAEVGVGEAGRLYASAVERTGLPFVTIPYDRTRSRQEHPFDQRGSGQAPYDTTILCVNADQVANFAADMGATFFEGRYTIGVWMWEVEPFPATMFEGFDFVDEVWAASDHAAGAIAAVSPKPVFALPPPLRPPRTVEKTRAELGIPNGFVFLNVFDFLSVIERKNPIGLIEAFTAAFVPGEGPSLVVKSINGDKRPEQLELLRNHSKRADVHILDGYLSPDDKDALMASCDAFVSLHRSEGLGLTMAEAMGLARPVIATGYSGNLTFMDDANSYLVPYGLVEIPSGCRPYPAGGTWAEPDLDAAATLMRRVFERPDEATRKARRAQEDIRTQHSPDARAPLIVERVAQIRRWRARTGSTRQSIPKPERRPQAPDIDGLRARVIASPVPPAGLRRAEQLIAEGARPGGSSRYGAAGGLVKRIALRLIRPYARHQRKVDAALAEAINDLQRRQGDIVGSLQSIVWLTDRVGKLQGEVGRARAATEGSAEDLDGRLDALHDELQRIQTEILELRGQLEEHPVIT